MSWRAWGISLIGVVVQTWTNPGVGVSKCQPRGMLKPFLGFVRSDLLETLRNCIRGIACHDRCPFLQITAFIHFDWYSTSWLRHISRKAGNVGAWTCTDICESIHSWVYECDVNSLGWTVWILMNKLDGLSKMAAIVRGEGTCRIVVSTVELEVILYKMWIWEWHAVEKVIWEKIIVDS